MHSTSPNSLFTKSFIRTASHLESQDSSSGYFAMASNKQTTPSEIQTIASDKQTITSNNQTILSIVKTIATNMYTIQPVGKTGVDAHSNSD